MMPQRMVIKRDGSYEVFDRNKIARVVKAAGLRSEQARHLASRIAHWVEETGQSELTSLAIKDRVLKELKTVHKPAADLYAWYEKTKE